jgi:hypothetical protein
MSESINANPTTTVTEIRIHTLLDNGLSSWLDANTYFVRYSSAIFHQSAVFLRTPHNSGIVNWGKSIVETATTSTDVWLRQSR